MGSPASEWRGDGQASPPTIVLAHDDDLVRCGLRRLLEERGVRVVGEVRFSGDAVDLVSRTRPDVAVMALSGPSEASRAVRRVTEASTGTRVVLLADSGASSDVVDALRSGASGYLLRDAPIEELLNAMRATAFGDAVICAPAVEALVERLSSQGDDGADDDEADELTAREREVLELLAAGREMPAIAERLFLSPHTVKDHVASVIRKLGARNRVHAAVRAVRRGIV